MASTETDEALDQGDLWPQVTENQRQVLDVLRRIYLETADWATHAYLEQVLDDQDITLDDELATMPELTFYPDSRRGGGGVFFQEADRIQLMFRGLVASSEGRREAEMFLGVVRWAVKERRLVRQQPHSVTEKRWRAADAIEPMAEAIGVMNPDAYAVKLVLEVMRVEPFELPKWGGQPDAYPDWQLDISSGVKRFRNVATVEDYLRETQPRPRPVMHASPDLPLWPETTAPVVARNDENHPIFGRITRRENSFDCFVLLPLSEPFRTIYESTVEPVARELGMSCGHAEGIFGPGRIMDDIVAAITYAKVIVAELTGKNPNVFYELGIAHQQGKQVVLMSQSIQDVPFDVRDRRVVVYHWNEAMPDADEIRHRLQPHLEGALRAADAQ